MYSYIEYCNDTVYCQEKCMKGGENEEYGSWCKDCERHGRMSKYEIRNSTYFMTK